MVKDINTIWVGMEYFCNKGEVIEKEQLLLSIGAHTMGCLIPGHGLSAVDACPTYIVADSDHSCHIH